MKIKLQKRHYFLIPLLIVSTLLYWYLSKDPFDQHPATKLLKEYLLSATDQTSTPIYRFISTEDKNNDTGLSSFTSTIRNEHRSPNNGIILSDVLTRESRFKLVSTEVQNNRLIARVKIIYPEIESLDNIDMEYLQDMMMQYMGGAFLKDSKIEKNAVRKFIAHEKQRNNLNFTETESEYVLINENEQWKVFVNWVATQHFYSEVDKSEQLLSQKKFEEARAILNELRAIKIGNNFRKLELEKLSENIQLAKRKNDYIKNIVIHDFKITKDLDATRVVSHLVTLSATNQGPMPVYSISLLIQKRHPDGSIIAERHVLIKPEATVPTSNALEPEQTWTFEIGSNHPTGLKITQARPTPNNPAYEPVEWSKGSINFKIDHIELQKPNIYRNLL